MNKRIQRISIKGLVTKDNKVFMVKDQAGNWEFPGGRIDFGEKPEETLRREFKEELDVDLIEIGEVIDIFSFTTEARGDEYHFIVVVYNCQADLSKVRISEEHLEYAWISFDQLDQYQMRNSYRQFFLKFLA